MGRDDVGLSKPAAWPAVRRPALREALAALSLGFFAVVAGCDGNGPGWWTRTRLAGACPRPQTVLTGSAPQFNQQQAEIRALRQQAFRGDFFAQLELGRRYEGRAASDKNLEDPVEAAVWYSMALANPGGYAPTSGQTRAITTRGYDATARYDDCRAFERRIAYVNLDRLLSRMSSEEQDEVRNRVTYVLSTEGADGLLTLARLHDTAFGPFGEPADNGEARRAMGRVRNANGAYQAVSLFERNDVDAYLYNYLAAQTRDVRAYVVLTDFESSSPRRAGYKSFAEAKAQRWIPPYEFYPPDAPASGVPHSDESDIRNDWQQDALERLKELPFVHVAEAMRYLNVTQRKFDNSSAVSEQEANAVQAMLGRPQTGRLQPIEYVRTIQYAAVNGSPKAQLVLAVMYAEGVGVPQDYARAFHWFQEADKQGSAEAKYAMSTYFSLGMSGVADQEKAKAVVYQLDSALAGFKPSAHRLQQLLARVSRYPIRRWYGPYAPYGAGGYGPTGYGAPGGDPGGYGPGPQGYGPGQPVQRGHIPMAGQGGDAASDPQLAEDSAAAGDSSRFTARASEGAQR